MDAHLHIDFNPHTVKLGKKTSKLHKFKAYPDPNGNRAERRAAKKETGNA